ncbi:MAG: hypothetical protein GY804_00010 [Alphaproteobacteria bacterium]|nr:hypothetical protein [Alphaproteobacteria bacterium]
MEESKCTDCKYCVEEDYGSSNYTVEGTDVDCLLGLNPSLPEDRFWGEEPVLTFAETCEKFEAGVGVDIDCDREDLTNSDDPLSSAYAEDPEIKLLLDKWENAPMCHFRKMYLEQSDSIDGYYEEWWECSVCGHTSSL